MNAKKFRKKIDKVIKEGILTNFTLEELKNEKDSFFNNKSFEELIKENYEYIMESTLEYKGMILKYLYKNNDLVDFLDSKIEFNMDILNYYELQMIIYENENILKILALNPNILDNVDYRKVVVLYKCKELLPKNLYEKVNEILSSNKKDFVKYVLMNKLNNEEYDENDLETLIIVLSYLLEELLSDEKVDIMNTEVLSGGSFSEVLQIGSKVLKVGLSRNTYDIPYDKHILLPIIRIDLSKISKIKCVVEVQDRVEVLDSVSKEELYNLYKEIRKNNIIATDIREGNVGRLIKDNDGEISKKISRELSNMGIEGKINKNPLKKGKLVLFDTDFIYRENSDNISWPNWKQKEYEKRYITEELIAASTKKFKEMLENSNVFYTAVLNKDELEKVLDNEKLQLLEERININADELVKEEMKKTM